MRVRRRSTYPVENARRTPLRMSRRRFHSSGRSVRRRRLYGDGLQYGNRSFAVQRRCIPSPATGSVRTGGEVPLPHAARLHRSCCVETNREQKYTFSEKLLPLRRKTPRKTRQRPKEDSCRLRLPMLRCGMRGG